MTQQFSVFQLEEGFLILKYETINIIFMTSNYFVNVSKLLECWNKDFTEWMQLEEAKKLINTLDCIISNIGPMYLEESYGACNSNVIIEIASNDDNKNRDAIAGFYVHRNLLPYIVSYISPLLAVKITCIIDYYINKKIETKFKVNESINKRLVELIDINSDRHTKEISNIKTGYNSVISDLKASLVSIKERNYRMSDRIQDIEAVVIEQKVDTRNPKLLILQHRENESMFKSLVVDAEECMIEKLHKIRKDYKLFFRTNEKQAVTNFESLKKRLLRDKCICLQKSGYKLIDKCRYYIRDMIKDLYDLKTC
ncbi:KilA N domain protein [Finch poxvirus]|uniref:KilA N domain protein n=2 Tax=unclassified Avipoxvirus TaxID=336487 RepID=A0AAT9UR54_9POXV|nr:KilA N domain protein [Finch poxvirus]UOX38979.1 KilA N domain protein [Finch poxvirus]